MSASAEQAAAACIQKAWRSHAYKRVYRYFRDLIRARESRDPVATLRALNPKEAALLDVSTGFYIRFRLGGERFPPQIFYKVYVSQPITDICAFAPRDYAAERKGNAAIRKITLGAGLPARPQQDSSKRGAPGLGPDTDVGWYRRWENNGWRPVGWRSLGDSAAQASVVADSHTRTKAFHYSRLVRQVDALRASKRKRLEWFKQT